jgi:benzoyl-CoA 2,3-dioxygenase component B
VLRFVDGKIARHEVPALSALNMRLRDDYVADCEIGIGRWNKVIGEAGIAFRIRLPSVAFHLQIGEFSKVKADIDGNMLSDAEWERQKGEFLPAASDSEFIESLMKPEHAPGEFAGWIAPPKVGIDNKPGDFEYVRIAA